MIAATNVNLRAALEEGPFGQDLYYRLNVVPINILRYGNDGGRHPILAIHFVEKLAKNSARRCGRSARRQWTGCGRPHLAGKCSRVGKHAGAEHGALSHRAGSEAADIRIESPRHSSPQGSNQQPLLPDGMTLEQWEQMMIREALRRANGNKSQAARSLGFTRNALRYRLSQTGLDNGGSEEPAE